jgi:hypothetical protein
MQFEVSCPIKKRNLEKKTIMDAYNIYWFKGTCKSSSTISELTKTSYWSRTVIKCDLIIFM